MAILFALLLFSRPSLVFSFWSYPRFSLLFFSEDMAIRPGVWIHAQVISEDPLPLKIKINMKKNFMAAFYGSRSIASRLEPLRGGSLLFTTKFPQISGTHFTDLERMKGWVNLGATQRFWTRDPWTGNPAPWPLGDCSINRICISIFLLPVSTEIIASNYLLFGRWTLERVKLFCWTVDEVFAKWGNTCSTKKMSIRQSFVITI